MKQSDQQNGYMIPFREHIFYLIKSEFRIQALKMNAPFRRRGYEKLRNTINQLYNFYHEDVMSRNEELSSTNLRAHFQYFCPEFTLSKLSNE